jgi:DNA-binding beta-propeller fold protein YncE
VNLLHVRGASVLSSSLVALVGAACTATDPDSYRYPTSDVTCDADLTSPDGYAKALKCDAYKSCAFTCSGCGEASVPYACPAMRGWSGVAHADACGAFDGKTFPVPAQGKCTATAPTGDALAVAGLDVNVARRVHLPDGHFIEPAGHEQVLRPNGVVSGFPLNVVLVPGTRFAIVTDSGVDDNAIEVIDLDALARDAPALVSAIAFPSPAQLYYGLAFVAPNRVFASGGGDDVVYAFTLDPSRGILARDAAADLRLGGVFVGALAASASTLVVAPSTGDSILRRFGIAGGAPATVDLGASATELFDVVIDPSDPASGTYWVSALDARELLRVDFASSKVTARLATGKNPEGIAPLGATHVAVASSDDDSISVFEVASSKLVQTLALDPGSKSGVQPGLLAYDATRKRLYATLSGVNAIGVFDVDLASSAPLTPAFRIPTAWWPTQVRVRDDGALVVLTGKGHGTGPAPAHYPPGHGATPELTRGSIALIDPLAIDPALATATVIASRKATTAEGYPTVSCPGGAAYDFPIPLTNDGAASTSIEHIVFVVRENKTYDAIFGDFGKGNGAPALVMSEGKMDEYWKNIRAMARAFAMSDDFYVDAEQSLQGHIWTSFGRSSDFIERTWTSSWGRARKPKAGIDPRVGQPAAGSIFTWLERNHVPYDDMGEVVGTASQAWDPSYPGQLYTVALPDVDKSCYVAARAVATCDLKAFTYVVLPNDHTMGGAANAPAPEVMIAVNDEATGMILDAISHSPLWPTTLVIVTEDDPQNGGDHVDAHRVPLVLASPWVKRGYVSATHIDMASLHKLFAHVLAKPYQSATIADAAVPYDLFTSTPDFTPYKYFPRTTETTCNAAGTAQAKVAEGWDLREPDEAPGLAEQVEARMRSVRAR